jgi:hypothetical protein
MTPTIQAAQDLGRRGFRVHPLKAKDQPYTPYSRTATSDPDAIAALFRPFPNALIAICTGQGLVVVDDDRGLPSPDPSMPMTLTARTRSRGWHYYFHCPTPLRNSVSKVAEGVDIRGEGGYVVAPPSDGYEWFEPLKWGSRASLPSLPGVLLAACLRHERAASEGFEPRAHVPAGERHDYLVRFAGWALANELADESTLTDVVVEHATDVCDPWPRSEMAGVLTHIRSVCRWVIARESGREE